MDNKIYQSLHTIPRLEGPIATTADSVPFCAMRNSRSPVDLAAYGYAEEEFFVSGKANIYQEASGQLEILHEAVPYKTRIIVRKPIDLTRFSGRVYFDILNATQNYDIEDLWHRIYYWCMEQGHGYVGITSKPVNVQSLKHYDYDRYKSLDWSSPVQVPQPVPCIDGEIPGTEEGLIWDMIAQTASAIRCGAHPGLFDEGQVKYLCLTGQSQSGFYLNTFIAHFDTYMQYDDDQGLFDGYMNIVGVPFERELRQCVSQKRFSLKTRRKLQSRQPLIMLSSEGDISLFKNRERIPQGELPLDCDTPENKCRYYEIAGSPHTDIDCEILSSNEEVLRSGNVPAPVDSEMRVHLNDFPLAEYICGFLEKLYIWKVEGSAPDSHSRFARNKSGELLRDNFQNVLGGFRSPYVDIPIASYQGAQDMPYGGISGKRTEVYQKDAGEYFEYRLAQLHAALNKQRDLGWLTENAVHRMVCRERTHYELYLQNGPTFR